jgi:hypothetical protein
VRTLQLQIFRAMAQQVGNVVVDFRYRLAIGRHDRALQQRLI